MAGSDYIQEKLFTYIKGNTFKDTSNLTSETMLFIEGILDSMGFALLLDHLEATFQIQAEDNDLIESNFESINAITDFVIRKKAQVT